MVATVGLGTHNLPARTEAFRDSSRGEECSILLSYVAFSVSHRVLVPRVSLFTYPAPQEACTDDIDNRVKSRLQPCDRSRVRRADRGATTDNPTGSMKDALYGSVCVVGGGGAHHGARPRVNYRGIR